MVGRRDVRDFVPTQPRHVAGGAVVVGIPLAARRLGQPAAPLILAVALQAPSPVIAGPLKVGWLAVRVVARDAAQLARAGPVAPALVHLLHLADELVRGGPLGPLEHRPHQVERQPGAEVVVAAVELDDPLLAYQVALLADGIAAGLQRRRIHDRGVAASTAGADVQLAGPVAPLAADRVAAESGRPIPVHRPLDRLDPVRVAVQAGGDHSPVEVGVAPR